MINYHVVDEQLSRSARPEASDFPFVLANFKSVLDLEGLEADIAEQNELSPLRVFAGDISDWEIYLPFGLTVKRVNDILDVIADAPKPILIHCQHGQDRTGLIVACYRVRHGWTKDEAMAEAKKYGYRYIINMGLNRIWRAFK